MPESIKVVILCGGLGTRMKEETEYRPKPLVEVGGMPILWHIMKIYSFYGFNEFVLPLGYKGHMIKEYFINYEFMTNDFTLRVRSRDKICHYDKPQEDWIITFVNTGRETNTGGRIKRIQQYINNDTIFMATYGDGLADINIKELLSFHKGHDCIATLTAVHPMSYYGVLDITEDKIRGFKEKPRLDGWINSGFFVFDRKIFDYIGENDVLEKEPLEKLAEQRQLAVYRHSSFWKSMDTFKDAQLLNQIWESGNIPWKIWE